MSHGAAQDAIAGALARHLGDVELVRLTRLTGGASATTTRVDLADGRSLIVRCQAGQGGGAFRVDARTEARVQAAAGAAGVAVAKVLSVLEPADGLGAGYVMECVRGDASPAFVLGEAARRAQLAVDAAANLAAIQRVPRATLPDLPARPVSEQVRALRDAYDSFAQPSAVFELAFRALAAHLPRDRPPVLVHGDFRTGNLLADDTGLCAVLDWELCHLGSPIEDLGWLCGAAWRFGRVRDRVGGFAPLATFRAHYLAAGGAPFDDAELTFWETYGTLRWGVVCLVQSFAHLRGDAPSIERAAVGRRVAEVELDLLRLLPGGARAARPSESR